MEVIENRKGKRYRESIYIAGKRIKSPHFFNKSSARKWKTGMQAKQDEAKLLGVKYKLQERIRYEPFINHWLIERVKVQKSESTYHNYKRSVELHFTPVLKGLYLDQISHRHADIIVSNLQKKGNNANGINKIMLTLRVLLSDAERNEYIVKNPLHNYPRMKVVKRPPTFWSHMEIKQFLAANVMNPYYHMFVVALNTGMRKGELAGLCWDRIDFNRNMIEISRIRDRYGHRNTTKSGRARHVPMNDVVRATLLRLFKKAKSKFVFVNEVGLELSVQHIYRNFANAQKRAEMGGHIRFHDLRHTFASHFMMNGGNLYDLQKILGHTSFEMTQIYAHLSPDHLANTTQILNFGGENASEMVPYLGQNDVVVAMR